MKVKKSYSFYCKALNQDKYNLLLNKALQLRDFKNKISEEVCCDITKFIEMSKFDWIVYFRCRLPYCNNQDISKAISDIYVSYENKFKKFKNNIKFKVQKSINVNYYKRKTKKHKRGDVKSLSITFKSTKITKILSYLCRYYNENMINWLKENKDKDLKKKELRNDTYDLLLKYNERVIRLIESRRNRIIEDISKHPIVFNSLSFSGTNELKGDILNRNKNERSIFGCVVTLGAQKTGDGKLFIPVKYDEDYHGLIEEYNTSCNTRGVKTVSYKICFPESRKKTNKIRIILTRDVEEKIVIGKESYLGVDVNIKHNLFYTSADYDIDYDRKMFNGYVTFLKKIDKKLLNKRKYSQDKKLSKIDQLTFDRWKVRIKDMLKRKSRALVDHALENNLDHIIMEDLQLMGKMFSRSLEFEGFKYSRLIRLLNLTDLKNIVSSIANKHGIQITFVQPHYTSKGCACGCIDTDNRKTQEMFSCVECGHTEGTDLHSSKMIKDRVQSINLRNKLLKSKDGIFTPKKLKKDSIKDILYDHYSYFTVKQS